MFVENFAETSMAAVFWREWRQAGDVERKKLQGMKTAAGRTCGSMVIKHSDYMKELEWTEMLNPGLREVFIHVEFHTINNQASPNNKQVDAACKYWPSW